jgi:hypothetical protein
VLHRDGKRRAMALPDGASASPKVASRPSSDGTTKRAALDAADVEREVARKKKDANARAAVGKLKEREARARAKEAEKRALQRKKVYSLYSPTCTPALSHHLVCRTLTVILYCIAL